MELRYTAEQEAWREEVRAFLDAELPRDMAFDVEFEEDDDLWKFAIEFTRKVGARGWIALTWPVEYGGLARPAIDRVIMMEEFTYREAPLVNQIGFGLAAGTLLVGGTEEQKQRFLPPIARMETFWAEGLSEPGAGSDLAALSTRAVRDGDHWIVNGQKTYTTWGTHADVLYLAARTDPNSTRHHGLSVFCLPLDAPGVTMTPMWNLGGGRQNHTYLDDVRLPHAAMLGSEGQGWHYIMNAFYAGGFGAGAMHAGYQRMFDEVFEYCRTTRRGGSPLLQDPVIRQDLGQLAIILDQMRMLTFESLSNARHKRPPRFGGALTTVVMKEAEPRFVEIIHRIMGPLAQLKKSPWAPFDGGAEAWYRYSYANHAGGTPQVKRMVLATRGLGLPR
jgi:alkylation response protein AidB-like acyl-CoA dehydrogenase